MAGTGTGNGCAPYDCIMAGCCIDDGAPYGIVAAGGGAPYCSICCIAGSGATAVPKDVGGGPTLGLTMLSPPKSIPGGNPCPPFSKAILVSACN